MERIWLANRIIKWSNLQICFSHIGFSFELRYYVDDRNPHGGRRLLTTALLSFRNKLVASGKPTEDINELLIRLLR